MAATGWAGIFLQQLKDTSLLEWIAVATGVAEVLWAKVNNALLYPAGIISTGIYIYIMSRNGLYAEAVLSIYYLVMSIYGWVHWQRSKGEKQLSVTRTTANEWYIATGIVIAGWAATYIALHKFTPSTVPVWDAGVAATAWAGMWLLARRKVENWLVLNLSNLFAIPLFIYKHDPLTACLTVFLFIVAIFGYIDWLRLSRQQTI